MQCVVHIHGNTRFHKILFQYFHFIKEFYSESGNYILCMYSDNQKTIDCEDDIKVILKCEFNVVTQQIVSLDTYLTTNLV